MPGACISAVSVGAASAATLTGGLFLIAIIMIII
jgi:hypothetical protein